MEEEEYNKIMKRIKEASYKVYSTNAVVISIDNVEDIILEEVNY